VNSKGVVEMIKKKKNLFPKIRLPSPDRSYSTAYKTFTVDVARNDLCSRSVRDSDGFALKSPLLIKKTFGLIHLYRLNTNVEF
jgi:hypothetical protein